MALLRHADKQAAGLGEPRDGYYELKARVLNELMDSIDLMALDGLDEEELAAEIRRLARNMLDAERLPLNQAEKQRIVKEIADEIIGLGPLEPLMGDPTVSDILVNATKRIYVERHGKLEITPYRFQDDNHLMRVINRIVSSIGRRIDESCPMVDARLKDGSRVNAIIPPLAIDGPMLSIRKFAINPLKLEDLISSQTLTPGCGELLAGIVKARLNVLISGGTGTGKTTLLNVLSSFISPQERIITIEDSAELQLHQDHVVRLETRPPNIEGVGEVRQRELVRNSLRMRPDRIIVGEVRGEETLDMLQAMNTGHDGSLATIHANSPSDALSRLETMVTMTGLDIPISTLRRYIASALHVVIQLARLSDGSRKIMSIQEIAGMERDIILMNEIFRFEQTGISREGKVRGGFIATGVRPRFFEKLIVSGIDIPDMFPQTES